MAAVLPQVRIAERLPARRVPRASSVFLHPPAPARLCSAAVHVIVPLRSYLMKHDETQSVFTGKQERDGVSAIPHLVAGVWGSRGALHARENVEQSVSPGGVDGTTLPVGDGIEHAGPDLAVRVAALHLDEPQDGESGNESDGGGRSPYDCQA